MARTEYDETEKLSLDPDNMTDEELLQTSLSVLTKNIAPTLPDYSIVLIYSQWLDVHRQNPTPLTAHWPNTTQQWVHALRSRGCTSAEIIFGLDGWKEVASRYPPKHARSRALPTTEDILMWYANDSVQGYPLAGQAGHGWHTGYGRAPDNFTGPPPEGYVCNRCGVPGHHLQACPTNLNPAYDKAPGETYTCTVCHVSGDHYRSICPHNTDPFSITQQRRMAFIAAGGGGLQPPVQQAPRVDPRVFQKGKRGRNLSSSDHSRSSNDGSPTPDKKLSLRKRMRRIEVYEDKLAKGKKLDSTQIQMIWKKADIEQELKSLDENGTGKGDESQSDGSLSRKSVSSQGSALDFLDKISLNQPNTPSPSMRIATYNEFTQKLVECQREEMTEVVNVMKPRPTALDKWEVMEVNDRNLLAMAVTGIDITSDPFLDDETIYRTLSAASQYCVPYNHGFSKTCGTGLDMFKVGMYEQPPYYGAYNKSTSSGSTGSSSLLDHDVLMAGPLTPLGSREHRTKRLRCDKYGFPKAFDPVIAPPKKPFDPVIAPPKRVPKDIANLHAKETKKEECRAHTRTSENTSNGSGHI